MSSITNSLCSREYVECKIIKRTSSPSLLLLWLFVYFSIYLYNVSFNFTSFLLNHTNLRCKIPISLFAKKLPLSTPFYILRGSFFDILWDFLSFMFMVLNLTQTIQISYSFFGCTHYFTCLLLKTTGTGSRRVPLNPYNLHETKIKITLPFNNLLEIVSHLNQSNNTLLQSISGTYDVARVHFSNQIPLLYVMRKNTFVSSLYL